MDEFFDGLDLVIEECDSLDMKVRVREEARARGIPVLMETSDRGLFDVERFDVEPERPLFHGTARRGRAVVAARTVHPRQGAACHADPADRRAVRRGWRRRWWRSTGRCRRGRNWAVTCNSGAPPSRPRSGGSVAASRCRPVGSGSTWTDALDGLGAATGFAASGPANRSGAGRPDRSGPGDRRGRRRARHSLGAVRREQPTVGGRRHPGRGRYPAGPGPHLGHGRRLPRQLCRHRRRGVQRPGGRRPALACRRRSTEFPQGPDSDLVVSIASARGTDPALADLLPGDGPADHQPQHRPAAGHSRRNWWTGCTRRADSAGARL